MLRTLRDTLPLLARHPELSQGARAIFRNASIVIPNGATLRRAVDIIAPISFLGMDADVKGDLFEHLASELGGQKKAAQFRTPRHLIRVITQMVNPQIGGNVCDPACGSGGFLIAAYEHILLANTSPEFVHEKVSPDGAVRKIGIGDKLSRAQWDFLQTGAFYGFDGDQDILRMAAMNAMLHGFRPLSHGPARLHLWRRGQVGRYPIRLYPWKIRHSPDREAMPNVRYASKRVTNTSSSWLMPCASLRPGGTAGIIFPNGILFGDTTSHVTVKERLLREFDLQAVGDPAQGNVRALYAQPHLFFSFSGTPAGRRKTSGSSRWWTAMVRLFPRPVNSATSIATIFPTCWPCGRNAKPRKGRAWLVPAQRIIDNGYNITLSGLGLIEAETVEHAEPEEILASVAGKEERILGLIAEMQELLSGGNGE